MEDFIAEHASAIFALLGVIFGSIVTGILNYISKTKETRLRITEKLLDKKLNAHESLIHVISLIRSMVMLGGLDEKNDLKRCPKIMFCHEDMEDFQHVFMEMKASSERWFSPPVKHEINFFVDYITTIEEYSRTASNIALQEVGVILKYDFIKIAERLEKSANVFFNEGLLKLDYKINQEWHKFPLEKTMEEFEKTDFHINMEKIRLILNENE